MHVDACYDNQNTDNYVCHLNFKFQSYMIHFRAAYFKGLAYLSKGWFLNCSQALLGHLNRGLMLGPRPCDRLK